MRTPRPVYVKSLGWDYKKNLMLVTFDLGTDASLLGDTLAVAMRNRVPVSISLVAPDAPPGAEKTYEAARTEGDGDGLLPALPDDRPEGLVGTRFVLEPE